MKYEEWKEKLIMLFNKRYLGKGKKIFHKWATEFIFDFYENQTPLEVFQTNKNIGEYL